MLVKEIKRFLFEEIWMMLVKEIKGLMLVKEIKGCLFVEIYINIGQRG